jgi:transcription elongation GreA/GreB family factor
MPSLEKQIKTAEKKLEAAREKLKKLFPGKSDRDIKNLMEFKDEREDPKKASANKTVKDLESRIRFLKQNGGTRRARGLKKTRRH